MESRIFDRLQFLTEEVLSRRRRAKRIKKEKQSRKNMFLDWIEAFLWAAGVVLLINQYLFQAYQIPSGSMIDTLLIGDRIFVNKLIYGPELLPGLAKLPSPITPKRNDIIIFESPSYISRGIAFDIAQRVIYMLTLSFVDIDKDELGQSRAHFLIKRAVGVGGDWIIPDQGDLYLRPAGESRWYGEAEFNSLLGLDHNLARLMREEDYPSLRAAGTAAGYADLGLPVTPALADRAFFSGHYPDALAYNMARLELLRGASPHDGRYTTLYARYAMGWYVPETRILPLGDNRDNSRDGRHFGPVLSSKVLGRGSIIYWPGNFNFRDFGAFSRFGFIR
ncbi:MAG: signal peptidase I [Treponema sp.]|nr:signal peptidase I [Treponema sp.]